MITNSFTYNSPQCPVTVSSANPDLTFNVSGNVVTVTALEEGTYPITITNCTGCTRNVNIAISEDNITLGCTDSTACNYNINATNDDGSCEFCSVPLNITVTKI